MQIQSIEKTKHKGVRKKKSLSELKIHLLSIVNQFSTWQPISPNNIRKIDKNFWDLLWRYRMLNMKGIEDILSEDADKVLKEHPWKKAWEITFKMRRQLCDVFIPLKVFEWLATSESITVTKIQ